MTVSREEMLALADRLQPLLLKSDLSNADCVAILEALRSQGESKPFDVMATIDPDYAESFERETCQLCGSTNGHSLSCVKIQRDHIDAASHPPSASQASDPYAMEWDIKGQAERRCSPPEKAAPRRSEWPTKGDHMTFLGKNGYEFELRDALNKFEVGKEYEVEDCNVQSWSHSVKFVGMEGWYNGVMFSREESRG